MQLFDISILLDEHTPVWPGDPAIQLSSLASREQGKATHVSQFISSSHAGTHIDAPFHFLSNGTRLYEIPIERFLVKTIVVEYPHSEHISSAFIRSLRLQGVRSVLFKTSNSRWFERRDNTFHKNFIALTPSAAEILVQSEVKLVGIDYLSIEPYDSSNHEVHTIFLKNDILILEGINLHDVPAGDYQLNCFPLKIKTPDGAPVRAILIKNNEVK